MTVTENIVIGAEPGSALSLDLKKASQTIRALSEEFKLAVNPDATIESLSPEKRALLLQRLHGRRTAH